MALTALAIYDYNRLVFICPGVVGVWMLVTVASASLLLAAYVAVAAPRAEAGRLVKRVYKRGFPLGHPVSQSRGMW